jgi:hypothetical protein
MRKPLSVLAVIGLTGTMTVALTGTAFAAGTTTTTAPKIAKVTKCQTKTATPGITRALMSFLTGGNAAAAMKYVDQGSKIGTSYEQSQAADTAAGLTSPQKPTLPEAVKVQCTGATKANFSYSLYFKDLTTGTTTAPLTTASGDALIKKGVWFISPTTVCDLSDAAISSVSDPTLKAQVTTAVTNCYQAIGQTLPPAS